MPSSVSLSKASPGSVHWLPGPPSHLTVVELGHVVGQADVEGTVPQRRSAKRVADPVADGVPVLQLQLDLPLALADVDLHRPGPAPAGDTGDPRSLEGPGRQ